MAPKIYNTVVRNPDYSLDDLTELFGNRWPSTVDMRDFAALRHLSARDIALLKEKGIMLELEFSNGELHAVYFTDGRYTISLQRSRNSRFRSIN